MLENAYVKINGAYTKVIKIFQRVNGTYKHMPEAFIKADDSYVKVHEEATRYPENCLALFLEDITPKPEWTQEELGNHFPKQSDSLTLTKQEGGSPEHHHGLSEPAYSGYSVHPVNIDKRTVGSHGRNSTAYSHRHTIPAHYHKKDAPNYPENRIRAVHYENVEYVVPGLIVFAKTDIEYNSDEWEKLTFTKDWYLELSETDGGSTVTEEAHNHGSSSWLTNSYYSPSATDTYLRSYYWYKTHVHNVMESQPKVFLTPEFRTYNVYKAKIPRADIPAGCILIGNYSMTEVPEGYILDATGSGKLIKVVDSSTTPGVDGGSDMSAHQHSGPIIKELDTISGITHYEAQSGHEKRRIVSHTHNYDHIHPAVDAEAPYIKYPLVQKD